MDLTTLNAGCLMRVLLAVSALLALTSCVGAAKLDSADSVPLVPDVESHSSYAVRCADAAQGDGACYVMDGDLEIPGQPGEFFDPAGSLDCPLSKDGPSVSAHVYPGGRINSEGEPGRGVLTMTFDCGGEIPEDGARYLDDVWVIGDMGTVLHYIVEAEYQAE